MSLQLSRPTQPHNAVKVVLGCPLVRRGRWLPVGVCGHRTLGYKDLCCRLFAEANYTDAQRRKLCWVSGCSKTLNKRGQWWCWGLRGHFLWGRSKDESTLFQWGSCRGEVLLKHARITLQHDWPQWRLRLCSRHQRSIQGLGEGSSARDSKCEFFPSPCHYASMPQMW